MNYGTLVSWHACLGGGGAVGGEYIDTCTCIKIITSLMDQMKSHLHGPECPLFQLHVDR